MTSLSLAWYNVRKLFPKIIANLDLAPDYRATISFNKSNIALFLLREKVEGDYLEFGVFRGDSFVEAYKAASFMGLRKMRFFAFDSFAGLPSGEGGRFRKGEFYCSKKDFRNNLKEAGVNLKKVVVVEGWYKDTLNEKTLKREGIKRAAWVHVDCDLYVSAKEVLDFITPLVTDGTVIVFNDWWVFKGRDDKGERQACREWLAKNPQIKLHLFMSHGYGDAAFVVQIN
jgi:hypothetical protein